ncbi:pilus assembly protein [Peteryoungia desertarenae]|uniref:Pilus assembly protein n=1 Tax=Peteryoungia desertarenae TaxID=1813451 RepID=A0ABX6QPQ1_9HYPH|nr:TadE/TadG family type IV pilus assembly protein [Peteryoungia desertarenae]QLF70533.1 pilus assembly protein [Peteryoungia desertarenae]
MRKSFLKRVLKDRGGVAGVEFALLAPLFIVMYVGAIEVTAYMTVFRRAEMANDSMAQILASSGQGTAGIMHHVWQVPSQVNPTSHYNWSHGNGKEWRNPFYVSQIVFKNTNPTCSSNCDKTAKRDFVFTLGMGKSCETVPLDPGKAPKAVIEVPSTLVDREQSALVVAHIARYKPIISGKLFGTLGDGAIDIQKIAYAVRHSSEPFKYPANLSSFYQYCDGPL